MAGTVLITGASGTVGKAAGSYLCGQGFNVIGVSRTSRTDENCYTRTESIDLLEEKDLERLEGVMKENEVKAVFHLAWNVSEENFDTGKKWQGNMQMFENVLEAAKNAQVPVFINGSSIHAGTGDIPAYTVEASLEDTPEPYRSSIDPGKDHDLRKDDPVKLLSPLEEKPDSPYGESKVETEHRTREAVENGDFKIGVSIRIGGVNSEDKAHLENEPYYTSLYWSHKDLGRTIENILESDVEKRKGYYQFYGLSDNEGRIFDIENPFIGETR